MIRDAALRDRITLFGNVHSADGSGSDADSGFGSGSGEESPTSRYGDAILVEGEGVTVAASVKPIKEVESLLHGNDLRTSYYRVLIRPDDWEALGVDSLTRAVYNDKDYDVLGEPQPFMYRNGVHHITFLIRDFQGG